MAGAKVLRSDPEVRRNDYLNALRFWLHQSDARLKHILFIENSGEDLTPFRHLVETENPLSREVEFISIKPYTIPDGLHYGWSELRMLDESLSKSVLAAQSSHMVKVTGRFTFPTISRLLSRMPKRFDVMVDCRVPTRSYANGKFLWAIIKKPEAYASTQIAIFSLRFYREQIQSLYKVIIPGVYPDIMESVIYEKLKLLKGHNGLHLRFPVNCEPSGIGASNGHNYNSRKKKMTNTLRGLLRPTGIWF